jgi:excisionase family DNA binding protein
VRDGVTTGERRASRPRARAVRGGVSPQGARTGRCRGRLTVPRAGGPPRPRLLRHRGSRLAAAIPIVTVGLDEPPMTANDVAVQLAVPRSSVYEYVPHRHRPLPSTALGRRRRFYPSDVEAWVSDLATCADRGRVDSVVVGAGSLPYPGLDLAGTGPQQLAALSLAREGRSPGRRRLVVSAPRVPTPTMRGQ